MLKLLKTGSRFSENLFLKNSGRCILEKNYFFRTIICKHPFAKPIKLQKRFSGLTEFSLYERGPVSLFQ